MNCPYCVSTTTKEQTQKTTLGYRTFRCSVCKHLFNERTGTPFNFLEYPTDDIPLKKGSYVKDREEYKESCTEKQSAVSSSEFRFLLAGVSSSWGAWR